MTIRDARSSDFPEMEKVCAAAFLDEELFGVLMHPHRYEYPDDFAGFFLRSFQMHWYDYNRKFLVSVDSDTGKILGVAHWERQGEGGKKMGLAFYDPRRYINCQILSYLQRYFFDPPNRAADPVQITILDRTFPHIEHYWSGSRTENWYLDLLAVHPDAQGKGCGRELVQWGIDQAKKDGVVASVISAKGKEGFYGKFGYVEVGRANVGPMSEAGIQGGAIMFTGTEEE